MEEFALECNGNKVVLLCSPRTRDRMLIDDAFRAQLFVQAQQQQCSNIKTEVSNSADGAKTAPDPFIPANETGCLETPFRPEFIPSPIQELSAAGQSPPSPGPSTSASASDPCGSKICWLQNDVKLLIALYKELHESLGKTFKCKTKSKMYREIAKRMAEQGCSYTPIQVEIKWRSLEKNYKKFMQHNNKTGRNRKQLNFEGELSEILNERAGIVPDYLLGSAGPGKSREDVLSSLGNENQVPEIEQELPGTTNANNDASNSSPNTPRQKPTLQAELHKFREDRQISETERAQFRREYLSAYNRRTVAIEKKNELLETLIKGINS